MPGVSRAAHSDGRPARHAAQVPQRTVGPPTTTSPSAQRRHRATDGRDPPDPLVSLPAAPAGPSPPAPCGGRCRRHRTGPRPPARRRRRRLAPARPRPRAGPGPLTTAATMRSGTSPTAGTVPVTPHLRRPRGPSVGQGEEATPDRDQHVLDGVVLGRELQGVDAVRHPLDRARSVVASTSGSPKSRCCSIRTSRVNTEAATRWEKANSSWLVLISCQVLMTPPSAR